MKIPAAFATVIVTLLAAHASAINFTPHYSDAIEDGVPMRHMYFSDGDRPVYFRPQINWSLACDEQAATFTPKDVEMALVKIENAPAEHARIAFDEKGLEDLRGIARSLVPSGSADVNKLWEAVNPVVFQGWTSFEVGFDYFQGGRHFCRSILFINLDQKRQIRFIVDAAATDFKTLYPTAYRTLSTWYEPSAVTKP